MFHPKTKLILMKGAGHQLIVDNTPSVNQEILAFMFDQDTGEAYRVKKDVELAAAAAKAA